MADGKDPEAGGAEPKQGGGGGGGKDKGKKNEFNAKQARLLDKNSSASAFNRFDHKRFDTDALLSGCLLMLQVRWLSEQIS